MSPEFKAVLEALVFPPGNVLLLAVVGALFLRGSRRRALIAISFVVRSAAACSSRIRDFELSSASLSD